VRIGRSSMWNARGSSRSRWVVSRNSKKDLLFLVDVEFFGVFLTILSGAGRRSSSISEYSESE
jgi:hypothetical protein